MSSLKQTNPSPKWLQTFYIGLLTALILFFLQNQQNALIDIAVLKRDVADKKDCCEKTDARLTALEAKFATLAPPNEYVISGYKILGYKISEVTRSGEELMAGEIYLLNSSYRWECARWNVIVQDGEVKPVGELIGALKDSLFKDAVAVVCVGTASSEDSDLKRQENLAAERMDFLHDKLVQVIPSKIDIYGFNFGQYLMDANRKVRCSNSTEEERRIFIVKITKLSKDRIGNLDLFLRRKFVEVAENPLKGFTVDVRDYSKYLKAEPMLRVYDSAK